MVKEITNEEFEKEVLNEDIVLVDFNASWCGPCRMLKPVLDELGEKHKIVSIDVDNNEELSNKYQISSIPCLILFKNGIEVKRSIGLKSKDEIEEMFGGE